MSEKSLPNHDFRALFQEHLGFVWRALRRHGVPEQDLDDLCQEVFLVVHRRLGDFEGRSSMNTWLYGIALRVAASRRRKVQLKREWVQASPPDVGHEPDPIGAMEQRTRLMWIEQALASLSEDKREAFALYELEHMTLLEVSRALGIPENTALYRLHAARDEIRVWVARAELMRGARRVSKKASGG